MRAPHSALNAQTHSRSERNRKRKSNTRADISPHIQGSAQFAFGHAPQNHMLFLWSVVLPGYVLLPPSILAAIRFGVNISEGKLYAQMRLWPVKSPVTSFRWMAITFRPHKEKRNCICYGHTKFNSICSEAANFIKMFCVPVVAAATMAVLLLLLLLFRCSIDSLLALSPMAFVALSTAA